MTLERSPDDDRPDRTEPGLMISKATINQKNNQMKPKKRDVKAEFTQPLP